VPRAGAPAPSQAAGVHTYIGKARWQRASGAPKQVPSKCQVGARQVPSRCQAGAEAASSQDEAMPGSQGDVRSAKRPSGRAQEGRRQPFDEVNGSHGAFAFEFRGSKFYLNLTEPTKAEELCLGRVD
jgi:hypothetical protein